MFIVLVSCYRIVGKFSRGSILRMGDFVTFHGSIFANVHNRAIASMYERAYFGGTNFHGS